jgi:hypothetical protein
MNNGQRPAGVSPHGPSPITHRSSHIARHSVLNSTRCTWVGTQAPPLVYPIYRGRRGWGCGSGQPAGGREAGSGDDRNLEDGVRIMYGSGQIIFGLEQITLGSEQNIFRSERTKCGSEQNIFDPEQNIFGSDQIICRSD